MEEQFDGVGAVAMEMPLERVDVLVALGPELAAWLCCRGEMLLVQELGMDPRDQHFLVIGAVEDANSPALRERLGTAPEEVVAQLFSGGALEGDDLAALGVDSRRDVLDRPVLACRVERLEDHEQRVGISRV